jgi:hypothetical protein
MIRRIIPHSATVVAVMTMGTVAVVGWIMGILKQTRKSVSRRECKSSIRLLPTLTSPSSSQMGTHGTSGRMDPRSVRSESEVRNQIFKDLHYLRAQFCNISL